MTSAPSSRTWRRWSATALSIAGLALICCAGWQYWGTTWVSRGHQDRIVEQLEQNWSSAAPEAAPDSHPDQPSADADADDQDTETDVHAAGTTAGAILRIPAFGSDYAMPILEGTSPEVLSFGVGHFVDTAAPGAIGNFALAAHRVTHGEPFRHLPDLKAGDAVIVDTARWRYTYALDTNGDALEVDLEDTWVTHALPRNPDHGPGPVDAPGQRLITLTTCADLFHSDSRLVAFGHLVERTPR